MHIKRKTQQEKEENSKKKGNKNANPEMTIENIFQPLNGELERDRRN